MNPECSAAPLNVSVLIGTTEPPEGGTPKLRGRPLDPLRRVSLVNG